MKISLSWKPVLFSFSSSISKFRLRVLLLPTAASKGETSMSSGETAPSLPEIPRAKQGLVESGKRAFVRGGGLGDSGLDLRDSAASSRSNSASTARPQPGLLIRSSPLPLSPRPPSPVRRVSVQFSA